MNLQFNCPFCQVLLNADASAAGSQIQCPSCQRPFVINAMPQVQARVVVAGPPPVPPPQPPRPQGPMAPRAPAPRPVSKQQVVAQQKQAEAGAKVAIAALAIAGIGVICGIVWFFGFLTRHVEPENPYALPPEVVARDNARRAEIKKQKEEEDKEASEKHKEIVENFTRTFDVDGRIAEQLAKEFEGVREDHKALTSDADPNNDPRDLYDYYTKRFGERAESNNILKNWLGGRPGTLLGETMWGDASERAGRKKGRVADFLIEGDYRGGGTGFFVSDDGFLVTNYHVVTSFKEVDVRKSDGTIVKARVLKADPNADLALLKTDSPAPASLTYNPAELQLGASVFTIGFPNFTIQGVEAKFTEGSISSLAGWKDDKDAYQVSVPIQHGNSGGALVDMTSGQVIGIVNAILDSSLAQNVSYAIKSSLLARLIDSVPEAASVKPVTGSSSGDRAANIDRVKRATVMVLVK